MKIIELNDKTKKNILENLLKRSPNQYKEYTETVDRIINDVRDNGDKALFSYTKKFDKVDINVDNIRVTDEEIQKAYQDVRQDVIDVIRKAKDNIEEFQQKKRQNSWFDASKEGIILGQKITPIEKVGIYVPGGTAPYLSTVLMDVIPAKVAGVPRIVMVTPPDKEGRVNSGTLVAAKEAGVSEIYKAGGAQAVAALAFGTESIPKVDKNRLDREYLCLLAKKAVYGHVSIDSIAGPSEILVLADETANPRFIAADILSQAEHDELASSILVTTSRELALEVSKEVDSFVDKLSRRDIIRKSLENYGYLLVAKNMDEAIEVTNEIATEHLEIITKDPFMVMTRIKNAGAIFIGEYSSEPLGDYMAGPNHTLPTNGTAKFFSPLRVDDFIKKSSIISYSKDALEKIHLDIECFAKAEGFTAHANSIAVRFED